MVRVSAESIKEGIMGPSQSRWFRNGYQQALADIKAKLDEGGEQAAREWIENNTTLKVELDRS